MNAFRFWGTGFTMLFVAFAWAGETNQEKIVGVWEVVKSAEAEPGSSVEFTKDGKLILTPKSKEEKKIEATYKIEGKKLTTTRREAGKKEEVNVLTIVTLTDTRLSTLNSKGSTDELKRKGK